jgi:hypothetical protein
MGGQTIFELIRRIDSQQLSTVKKTHLGTAIGLIHIMGGHEDSRTFLTQSIEEIPDCLTVSRIEAGSWFIQDKQGRAVNKRAADRRQLLKSTRELASALLVHRKKVQFREQCLDLAVSPSPGNAIGTGKEPEIFEHRQIWIQTELLGHIA